jgi:hypothetical protein
MPRDDDHMWEVRQYKSQYCTPSLSDNEGKKMKETTIIGAVRDSKITLYTYRKARLALVRETRQERAWSD